MNMINQTGLRRSAIRFVFGVFPARILAATPALVAERFSCLSAVLPGYYLQLQHEHFLSLRYSLPSNHLTILIIYIISYLKLQAVMYKSEKKKRHLMN